MSNREEETEYYREEIELHEFIRERRNEILKKYDIPLDLIEYRGDRFGVFVVEVPPEFQEDDQ